MVATLELNPLVVVATEEDNPLVVVATDEDKLPMVELNPNVVVATEELRPPILVDILELNVEYPVVPVISICDEPDAIPDGFDAMLSQVVWVIEPLNTYLPSYDDVNCEEPDIIPDGIPVNPE